MKIKDFKYPIILSLLAVCLDYFVDNFPYPFFDDLGIFCKAEKFVRTIVPKHDEHIDAFFVNFAYDKDTATFNDGFHKGYIDVTDRKKLYEFLCRTKDMNAKFIYLDIRFEKEITTPYDSALFSAIQTFPNVYFSHHSNVKLADSLCISQKALLNDYFASLTNTNFSRYQFVQDGRLSPPAYLDSLLNGKTIHNFGPIYYTEGGLCKNCPMIVINKEFYTSPSQEGKVDCYDWGGYLSQLPDEQLRRSIENNIVFVGDFINDTHETYINDLPGPYIVYLAYKTLADRKHMVSWTFYLFLMLLYIVLFYLIITHRSVVRLLHVEKFSKEKIGGVLISFFTYGTFFFIVCTILYVLFDITYNVLIPTTLITALEAIVKNKKV